MLRIFLALFSLTLLALAEDAPPVKTPPDSFFQLVGERDRPRLDRQLERRGLVQDREEEGLAADIDAAVDGEPTAAADG